MIYKMSLKKIYDEVTEDIFIMSNVLIFKEIEKKNGGCLYLLCLRSAELSKAFAMLFQNICSDASRVQDC